MARAVCAVFVVLREDTVIWIKTIRKSSKKEVSVEVLNLHGILTQKT